MPKIILKIITKIIKKKYYDKIEHIAKKTKKKYPI